MPEPKKAKDPHQGMAISTTKAQRGRITHLLGITGLSRQALIMHLVDTHLKNVGEYRAAVKASQDD